jgi:ribosomal protein S18 acetylase RimI-like enzyme
MGEIAIRCLEQAAELNGVFALNDALRGELAGSSRFEFDTNDYIADHVEASGFILGAFEGSTLVGYLIASIPGQDARNLGYDLGLDSALLNAVVHLDSVVVQKAFRGRGLQFRLQQEAITRAVARGFSIFLATVHPENLPSIINLFRSGLAIVQWKIKYSDKERYIMRRDTNKPSAGTPSLWIGLGHTPAIVEQLEAGLIGSHLATTEGSPAVGFTHS